MQLRICEATSVMNFDFYVVNFSFVASPKYFRVGTKLNRVRTSTYVPYLYVQWQARYFD